MGASILGTPTNLVNNRKEAARIIITIGKSGEPFNLLLVDRTESTQPYRTQYDVALDGTTYVVGAGKGVGNFVFKVLDGPFQCPSDSQFASMTTNIGSYSRLSDRQVKITVPDGLKGAHGKVFNGTLNSITNNNVIDENGAYYIISLVDVNGVWAE